MAANAGSSPEVQRRSRIVAMSQLDLEQQGAWTKLLPKALRLMDHLATQISEPHWTFGGGTVLMFRLRHRHSKDIDLFVPDPQYLGHLNPRLSDAAEEVSSDYEESAEFIKFFLPAGEIDIVVGASLTHQPYEIGIYKGHSIKFETSAEIIAKKMWHRGDQAKARDLFDLCAVATLEPDAVRPALPFFAKHGEAFLKRLEQRSGLIEAEFNAIDALEFRHSFSDCLKQAKAIIKPLLR